MPRNLIQEGVFVKYVIRLFKLASPWKHLIIIASIALLTITGINLVSPSITRSIINTMETNLTNDALPGIIWLGALLVGLNLLRAALQFVSNYFQHKASWNLVCRVRCMLYDHYQKLSMGYYHDKQTGQLMSRVINDTVTFENLIAHAIPDLTTNVITFIGVTVILLTINLKLTLLVCIPIPFIAFLSKVLRNIRKNFRKAQENVAELNAVLQDNFSGMKEIQIFNKQEHELERVTHYAEKHRSSILKALIYSGVLHPTVGFVTSLGSIVVLVFGPIFALHFGLKIADVVAFLLYLNLFYGPVSTLARILEDIQNAMAGAERVFEVLDTEPDIKDKPGAREVGILNGDVGFEHVSFHYKQGQPILKDISFDIKAGQMIALVGPTGVGKTTISSLLARFYEPQSGRITIDGIPIDDMTLHSLRNQLSVVLQDVFLFNGTIAENIAYGCDGASMEQIVAAAKTACIHDFIVSLPEQYETKIGERGVRLSGGQKQRISIARSVLRDSPILLLDEATSSVDTETETQIQRAINQIAGTRTLIVIAHRLSTVKKADKIIVLENGEVAETGTHEDLLIQDGVYKKLCSIQSVL